MYQWKMELFFRISGFLGIIILFWFPGQHLNTTQPMRLFHWFSNECNWVVQKYRDVAQVAPHSNLINFKLKTRKCLHHFHFRTVKLFNHDLPLTDLLRRRLLSAAMTDWRLLRELVRSMSRCIRQRSKYFWRTERT